MTNLIQNVLTYFNGQHYFLGSYDLYWGVVYKYDACFARKNYFYNPIIVVHPTSLLKKVT